MGDTQFAFIMQRNINHYFFSQSILIKKKKVFWVIVHLTSMMIMLQGPISGFGEPSVPRLWTV